MEGACANAKLGNLTELLADIRPAVKLVETRHPAKDVCATPYLDEIAVENVQQTIADIREKSAVISDLESAGKLKIVGAMYDIGSGKVTFL